MLGTILQQTATDAGQVAVDRLIDLLHITRAELAAALRVSRDSVAKPARARAPATQGQLRDLAEILKPLPSFGDQTAEALVKDGRAEAVKRHLGRIAVGGSS